jgi:hypothetical protein
MRYGYIFLLGMLVACSGEADEDGGEGVSAPTIEQLRERAKQISEKALDLTGEGITEIPPIEIGDISELPDDLTDSYVADYLIEEGFDIDEVDEDIVPPNESKWISITLSNSEVECEVSKFYKNQEDGILVTEGVHCSSIDE